METHYRKLGYIFLLIIPLVIIGFYPSYFGLFPEFNEHIDVFVHIHFLLSLVWIAILITQPLLIINKKYKWHKRIGRSTYIIFPLWILSFLVMIYKVIQKEHYDYLVFPIGNMLILIILYVLAIKHRKKTAKHMRYMIASGIVLIDPTIGRWTFNIFQDDLIAMPITYTIMNLILIGLIWMDKRNGKDYKPYVVALTCFLIYNIAFFMVYLN
ncbi:hypothetical protein [Confluentibacter flavum]|uniref:DUF2306 domain-containing protein n=1 Tax=Confluentibacter flavum TaxID=1909700 RepID=A0A2N3HH25_9FLAO|nr:hypothetical protein [Confluentibacter flavum]PKQ44261.1 hypothetical protein CSW08_14265 [Confluentibacter flavum]